MIVTQLMSALKRLITTAIIKDTCGRDGLINIKK